MSSFDIPDNKNSSAKGLRVGVILAAIIALVLTIAFIGTIYFSHNESEGLKHKEISFSSFAQEQAAPPDTYDITLDVGTNKNVALEERTIKTELDTPVGYLPYATLDGMRFIGWYTAPEGDASAVKVDNNSLELLALNTDQTLYARFEPRPTSIDHSNAGLPIMMYHYFYNPDLGEVGQDANWMNIHLFNEHLAYLQSQNYYFPTWEEVEAYIRGEILLPVPSIVLCSDDGDESFFRLAAPLVVQYGAKMTSFIVLKDLPPSRLTEYSPETISIQSHSYDMHRGGVDGDARILTSSYQEIYDDAVVGKQTLGNALAFCYPYGKTNANAKQALADAGVGVGLVIANERAYPLCDPMEVPRLRLNDGATVEYLKEVAS